MQRRVETETVTKRKLLQKEAVTNCLSIKAIFERNEPSTSSQKDTHSADLQNNLQVSPEIIQPEKHPTTITLITCQTKIIAST